MKLVIEFISDWHVGSGTGIPGSIDSLVLRDGDGLPFVPAKTLTGMLRDGCELVAAALGAPWFRVVAGLFGEQSADNPPAPGPAATPGPAARPARIGLRRAELLTPVRQALAGQDRRRLRDALGFISPHVAIDAKTGRADDDKLFFVEAIRAGAQLEASIQFPMPRADGTAATELNEAEAALLEAGALAVRRIGGKRRRGLGACKLRLEGGPRPPEGHDDWLSWLLTAPDPEERTPDQAPAHLPGSVSTAVPGCTLPYAITAHAPLCIAGRTTGNVVESLDHVPGTMLLPLVHRALEGAGFPDVAGAIRGGAIVVTNAYPEVAGGAASWPVPHALSSDKDRPGLKTPDGEVWNLLRAIPEGRQQQDQRKGHVSAGCPAGLRPHFRDRQVRLQMHNTIQDQVQRPTEEVGGVFSFEAIPAGTRLRGELRIAPPDGAGADDVARWREALNRCGVRYAVGKAKKDEYGDVTVVFEAARPAAAAPVLGSELVVWLLSDVLLRSRTLGWSTDPADLAAALGQALDVRLELAAADEGAAAAVGRARRQEGWIRSWDMPRPSLLGLAAGSCFRFSIVADEPQRAGLPEKIARLHLRGIGERRAEGFGQLCIDPPMLATQRLPDGVNSKSQGLGTDAASGPRQGDGAPFDEGAREFLRAVESEAWQRAIREAAARYALVNDTPLGIAKGRLGHPPSSQLGALRTAFAELQDAETGRKAVIRWLVRLMAVYRRYRRWPPQALQELFMLVELPLPSDPPDFAGWDIALRSPAVPDAAGDAAAPRGRRNRRRDTAAPGNEATEAQFPPLKLSSGHSWEKAHVWKLLFSGGNEAIRFPPVCTDNAAAALTRTLWPFAVRTLIENTCAAIFDERERGVHWGAIAASAE